MSAASHPIGLWSAVARACTDAELAESIDWLRRLRLSRDPTSGSRRKARLSVYLEEQARRRRGTP